MLPDGTYTGVVDSIEDGLATVFLERDDEEVDDYLLDAERLPEAARHQDAILHMRVVDDEIVEMTYDVEQTEQRQEAAQSRFDRLSKRPPQGRGIDSVLKHGQRVERWIQPNPL